MHFKMHTKLNLKLGFWNCKWNGNTRKILLHMDSRWQHCAPNAYSFFIYGPAKKTALPDGKQESRIQEWCHHIHCECC